MKKAILLSTLLILSTLLSACSTIVQGVAAVTSVATMSNDRRSAGTILDDKTLYLRINNIVEEDVMLDDAHINFMIYDGVVLMTGEAPSQDAKTRLVAQLKAKALNMKQLVNEVVVMPSSSYLSRAKDNLISLQVEVLFQDQEVFHPTHIRVLTERKTVYLMGAVTKREAENATNQAAKAKNVGKVVRLFSYLSKRPASEIERDNLKLAEDEKRAALEAKKAELAAAQAALQEQIDTLN
ncbi:MAG TPA: BON domain-containing protein [Candidatus Thioglobus sp.]|nr:BON domain-containing protein [Candidatus Thioglobus sp.]HIL21252.1 BON domain-containing protein [Candidatus Thioglobus sp.]